MAHMMTCRDDSHDSLARLALLAGSLARSLSRPIHTVLQLKPPQSPMLPCHRNISFPANSYPLKCRKFHFLGDATYSTTKPIINGHLYKMATTMICNANIECTFAVVACNGHLHTITNTNTSLSKPHKTST